MLVRSVFQKLNDSLNHVPVVALLGPRQVGKTTLALRIAEHQSKKTVYLDLELDSDLNKLNDAENYLKRLTNHLVIIDEVQRKSDLFRTLRSIVDLRKRAGENAAQFLLLGSASRDLLQQSSETLAGRIRYLELSPFSVLEVFNTDPTGFNVDKLWLRGGFPDSFLAAHDDESWQWRNSFISTYVERDIPTMGPRISPSQMKKFWAMLAHYHGQQVNFSKLGKSLEVTHPTIKSYLDVLTEFYMVRQIQPWSGNSKKRLVKSPKIYIRDSGILHKLFNVSTFESLLGNPASGASWEGFVVENIVTQLSDKWQFSYYRSTSQSEIDLVLEGPDNNVWAIEIKRGLAPTVNKGFHTASEDIKATHKYVVYPGNERYPLAGGTEVIGLIEFLQLIEKNSR
ncbi:MAG: ATP-binding protein [Cyclobacteriaceae bacterium]|nr:ATP-binding protein [Cyclobacteriaceae bacterium]